MKTSDLLRMCVENLLRRKARTFLSVLGVIIGCCSILLMLSIGVGLSRSNEEWLNEMGALNQIDVYPSYGNASEQAKLDNNAMREMRRIENVQSVIPKFVPDDLNMQLSCGDNDRYTTPMAEITGFDMELFEDAGYALQEGELPQKSGDILIGSYFEYYLTDSRRPEGHNMVEYYMYDEDSPDYPEPYMRLIGRDVTLFVRNDEDKVVYTATLHVTGILKEDFSVGYETYSGVLIRSDDLQHISDDAFKALGKKRKVIRISELKVVANEIDNVAAVQEEIEGMGFNASSMESMRESTQKETATIQLVLGGIGAVSLLVAAIGIINTMIMSVSERTREIGVMKAIGCYVRDIRKLFLMEAAAIGLIGGIVGAILSYLISFIINFVSSGSMGEGVGYFMSSESSRISIIPLWLAAFGLAFSTVIGLAAGFYPANKAVRISALEAMRNE